jgi:dienelactone hydrolase
MKHLLFLLLIIVTAACNNSTRQPATEEPKLKEETVTYTGDSVQMNGFLVYEEGKDSIRPAVLVVHEWDGLNDYAKYRARELAKLGYVAFAADVYGNGKTTTDPDSALAYSLPFYENPQMTQRRIDAAIAKIKTYRQVDTNNIAAVGYCFGGGMLLNSVRLGTPLKAIVSFHGSLVGTPANKDLLKSAILVCHGGDDPFVTPEEVAKFKKQMDSIGAHYTFKVYENARHGFTNPAHNNQEEPVLYNAKADSASWMDMKAFFQQTLAAKQ